MLQTAAKPRCTFCVGATGTGKTTFALRYLVADKALKCRFIFDPEGEFSQRLGIPAAETEQELECAFFDGFVLFDPERMFGEDFEEACEWFCGWVFDICTATPGLKVLYISEVWMYQSTHKMPKKLGGCIRNGRKRGLTTLFDTQEPNKVNGSITNAATELVCFNLQEKWALDRAAEMGADRAEVEKLPLGSFVAINRRSRGVLRGKIF